MQFHPNYPIDNNKGQRLIWQQIKNTFERDEGVAYYRYPIFSRGGRGRSEPDFLIIHRKYGVWVLESKGCYIGNIGAIEGHDWSMRDWYSETMSPVSQAEAQMFEVKTLVERNSDLRQLKIPFEYRVVLPFITMSEWKDSGFSCHPSTDGVVWLKDDIEGKEFRANLKKVSAGYMPNILDADWSELLGAFRGQICDEEPRQPVVNSPPVSPSRIIHAVESRLRVLDEKQDRVAQEVPEGPQRIRGLAGTGKTVLFARRAAQMHAANPEWNIAFVYWSRALHQMMKELVEKTYRQMTGDMPDWKRLCVWHAWGSKELTGFYRESARRWGCKFLSLRGAKDVMKNGETEFGAAMRILENESQGAEPFLDAILIDEGQDLPAAFYRIAHRALKDPKRLYWAYDEAQGIDSLIVPHAADVFGRNREGRPNIDLSGSYPSGIQKAHNMNRCYRTPRLILTVAHAINMGLLREGGPLQGVTNKSDWENLGYRIVKGGFDAASVRGSEKVVIERPTSTSGHPIDDPKSSASDIRANVLEIVEAINEGDDVEVVASGIQRDLDSGLHAEDIAVVCLDPWHKLLALIEDRLQQLGVGVFKLDNSNKDKFRCPGSVTLTGIRRAKGNEAYKVYVLNLHIAGYAGKEVERELVARNQMFVALTRAKIWCVVVGREGPILKELQKAKAMGGKLEFPAFNQNSLKRTMEDRDGQQQLVFGES
ncbi:MAG TPA: hypothetical protein ENI98_05605 [Gammaproteobacteria bacterium]|nr:hypothetical protein [Gammaproteobacteria bacterium]